MKFAATGLLLASTAVAVSIPAKPFEKISRDSLNVVKRAKQLSDTDILNFALTLEHLENAFYSEALSKYSQDDFDAAGYSPQTRPNILVTGSDESTHVKTLQSVLGDSAVPPCNYSFGITDIDYFTKLAGILEGVGVTAYLGAAALITDPTYLTVAGSILTVEARHSAFIRENQLKIRAPFAQPFDVPLSAMAVYSLASQFITSCPSNADLGFTAFPTMTVAKHPLALHKPGKVVVYDLQEGTTVSEEDTYAAFVTVLGPVFTKFKAVKKGSRVRIQIPEGIAGQSYVVLSKSDSSISDDNIVAGPGIVQIPEASLGY